MCSDSACAVPSRQVFRYTYGPQNPSLAVVTWSALPAAAHLPTLNVSHLLLSPSAPAEIELPPLGCSKTLHILR